MRRVRLILLMALLIMVVAACSTSNGNQTENGDQASSGTDATPDSSGAGDTEDKSGAGGTLVVNLSADAVTMDPAKATDINTHRVHYNMFDTLISWDEERFDMIPRLAESWTESEDGLAYTFKLVEGATFHDGTPVDAEAVKFSFERILDENHPQFTGPYPLADFYYGVIDRIEVIDPLTVKMTLKEPSASFLFNLTAIIGGIVSPTAVEEFGEDFGREGVGSGPFKLENWQRGVQITLAANTDYWAGAPKVDSVVFQPSAEDLVRVTKLLTGEADIIYDVAPDSIQQLQDDSNFNLMLQASPHLWYVGLNLRKAPFDDLKVRQAVNYAIDKESIVNDILKGTGTVATQPLAPAYNGHDPSITGYPYNPEKAKQLLKEAGYENGIKINFTIPESGSGMQSPVPMAIAMQSYLKDVGIEVEIKRMEWGAFLAEVNQGGQDVRDMWALSWMAITGDDDNMMTNLYSSNNIPLFNSGYYENERVTQLLEEAKKLTDLDERAALYREASRIITEEAAMIFVDYANQTAASSANIKGFKLHPSQMLDLRNVSK